MAVEVLLPKLGLTMEEGTVEEWLVEDGAAVEIGTPLLRLATDKVDVDVEAEAAGLFRRVVPAGTTLSFFVQRYEPCSTVVVYATVEAAGPGSWVVSPSQYGALAQIAQAMIRVIERNPDTVFMVEGHTDAVGNNEDNLSLSDRRAESVAVILTQQFNIGPEQLVTQGYGEQYLKIPTDGPSRENRRVAVCSSIRTSGRRRTLTTFGRRVLDSMTSMSSGWFTMPSP